MNDEDQIYTGYEFESGMFVRVRSWTDVVPWVALARVLRVLASPALVGLTTVNLVVTATLTFLLCGNGGEFRSSFTRLDSYAYALDVAERMLPLGPTTATLFSVLMAVLWIPVVAIACRQGAALTAGRPPRPLGETIGLLSQRMWRLYLIPLVPIACVLAFLLILLIIRLPSMAIPLTLVSTISGWVIGLFALIPGLLAFAAPLAIPLGLAALMNEADPDPIDSLSRGYEYVLRRPLHLIWYLLVALILAYVVQLFFGGVWIASTLLVGLVGSLVSVDAALVSSAAAAIQTIWLAAQLSLQFSLWGGIYLLLRRDAGGQHVEELWLPESKPVESLPSLPNEAFES